MNKRIRRAFDPFPKSGLVQQYEGFIRDEVAEYCRRYPGISREDFLVEAVRIACLFEPKFDLKRGYDFSTPLRHHLKGLHRFAEKMGPEQIPTGVKADPNTGLEADEVGEPTRPVNFGAGANGTRVTIDRLWMTPDPKGGEKRHRIIIGTQLPSADEAHALGVTQGISEDIPHVLVEQDADRVRIGYLRAIVDDRKRRQRETDQEAENQKHGDYKPVFLEVRRTHVDIAFYKGRRPPRFRPTSHPMVSLSDSYSHDDGWVGSLYDTLASGNLSSESGNDMGRINRLRAIIDAERRFLSPKEAHMLDWMIAPAQRTMTEAASEIGIQKSYGSKIVRRLTETMRRVLK